MEIRIKTAAEFRDAHVMIEVRAADADEAALVAEQLSEARAKAHAYRLDRTSERERADKLNERNAELEAELARMGKGHVCTARCEPNRHVALTGRQRLDEVEAEASEARRRIIELTRDLEAERERADENRAWAERAEGRLAAFSLDQKARLAEAERAIEILSTQLGRISSAVHGQELVQTALRTTWERQETRAMAEAIRQVRDALGSPSLPSLPSPPNPVTSQA